MALPQRMSLHMLADVLAQCQCQLREKHTARRTLHHVNPMQPRYVVAAMPAACTPRRARTRSDTALPKQGKSQCMVCDERRLAFASARAYT